MRHTLFIAVMVISFVAVAVFGFTAIGSEGCIATIATGGTCPAHGNFSVIEFYLTTFKSFSTSIVQLTLLVALLVVAAVTISMGISCLPQPLVVRSSRDQQAVVGFSLPLRRKFQRWLRQRQSTETNLSF